MKTSTFTANCSRPTHRALRDFLDQQHDLSDAAPEQRTIGQRRAA